MNKVEGEQLPLVVKAGACCFVTRCEAAGNKAERCLGLGVIIQVMTVRNFNLHVEKWNHDDGDCDGFECK